MNVSEFVNSDGMRVYYPKAKREYNISNFNCGGYAFEFDDRFVNLIIPAGINYEAVDKDYIVNPQKKEYLVAKRTGRFDTNQGSTYGNPIHYWKQDPVTGEWWDKPGVKEIRCLGYASPEDDNGLGWIQEGISQGYYTSSTSYFKVIDIEFWTK